MLDNARKLAVIAAAIALTPATASAAINLPVPTNAFINFGGLDWAWASPCSPTGCNGGQDPLDLSFQAGQGWRLPTAAEFLARPTPSAFIFAGANVPLGGMSSEGTIFTTAPGAGACAAAYFTPGFFNQCNYNDAQIGAIFGDPGWASERNVETWLVRGRLGGGVPEPATWAMMIGGFGAVGGTMRYRRRKTSVSFA